MDNNVDNSISVILPCLVRVSYIVFPETGCRESHRIA